MVEKGAYVTFLAGEGDYVKGVVGLAKGLRKVGSGHPLVVAALPDVPESDRRVVRAQGCIVREIEPVGPPEGSTQFAMPYYVVNYSKLRIWEFVEYRKMVYLDADVQVYENIDHLFDLPDGHLYAVKDCFCESTWSHTWQHRIGYCQHSPAPPPWPEAELGPPPPAYFNAGVFVHEPGFDTCNRLLSTLKASPPTPFAEQDLLNAFFRRKFRPLPPAYNLVLALLWRHPTTVSPATAKVVHYCAKGSKPWRFTGKEENMDREDVKALVRRWWEVYSDEELDYKGPDRVCQKANRAWRNHHAVGEDRRATERTVLDVENSFVDAGRQAATTRAVAGELVTLTGKEFRACDMSNDEEKQLCAGAHLRGRTRTRLMAGGSPNGLTAPQATEHVCRHNRAAACGAWRL
ncbi:galactinol synthase 2-like [Wolffia australiana]